MLWEGFARDEHSRKRVASEQLRDLVTSSYGLSLPVRAFYPQRVREYFANQKLWSSTFDPQAVTSTSTVEIQADIFKFGRQRSGSSSRRRRPRCEFPSTTTIARKPQFLIRFSGSDNRFCTVHEW